MKKGIGVATLEGLLQSAKCGVHIACQGCPWNPISLGSVMGNAKIPFGKSCCDHGIDYNSSTAAVSMQIWQDPWGTTPAETGCLCFVCNSKKLTDHTAKNARDLWMAAVALRDLKGDDNRYLPKHYWTNAVMHGADGRDRSKQLKQARSYCKGVLLEQMRALSPEVVIACGKVAADSLFDLKLLKKSWKEVRKSFFQGAYYDPQTLSGAKPAVYVTYHTSAWAVYVAGRTYYTKKTDSLVQTRIKQLSDRDRQGVNAFLTTYGTSPIGRGMQVLLLHWLDIGKAIRLAHG